MKEKPILFSGEMVRAILDGRKTQTRRVIKDLPDNHPDGLRITKPRQFDGNNNWYLPTTSGWMKFYANPGNLLWVREAWQAQNHNGQWWHEIKREDRSLYHWAVTNPVNPSFDDVPPRWLPSIHMPRWASRITLRIVDVHVERVQDISEADAIAEGIKRGGATPRHVFMTLWDSINAKRGYGWDQNPYVWVITFEKA